MTDRPRLLEGCTALVTGASGGIGAEIAIALAEEGAKLALHYRQQKPKLAIEKIAEMGGVAMPFQSDFSTPQFQAKLQDDIERQLPGLNLLVNCAADQQIEPLASMTQTSFEAMIATNLTAVFLLSQEFANRRANDKSSPASIVNVSSVEAHRPASGHGHYAVSKAGLETLTKSMALEFGHTGLRVNAIAPGLIARENIETDWPQGVQKWNAACPLGRMGQARDVANAVVFLASKNAAFING